MARHRKFAKAVRSAVLDKLFAKDTVRELPADVRIDGKTCLVTGANSGLGKAVAIDLARRGGHVLMACRSGHPNAGKEVRRLSGSNAVEMLRVDLADLRSVHRLCDDLRARCARVDIVVLNAGLMPRTARRSAQGYDVMFAVHFLANRVLVDRSLADGVVKPSGDPATRPRIVQVTSETHRSSDAIDFDRFGAFADYGIRDGLKYYGLSKLHSCTFARELHRRIGADAQRRVAVHALCPGPIASNIAREAPFFLKPLLVPVMKLAFSSPARAARPVTYLCCSEDAGERSGIYLHMMQEKEPSRWAMDPRCGARLWEASAALVHKHAPTTKPIG